MLPLLLLIGVGAFLLMSKDQKAPPADQRIEIRKICSGPFPPFVDMMQAKLDEVVASGKTNKEIAAEIRKAVKSEIADEYLKEWPQISECLLKVADEFEKKP